MRFATARCWVKDKEIVIHLLVNFHYTGFISTSVAIVGSGEDCHNLLLMTPIVALRKQTEKKVRKTQKRKDTYSHDKLMRSCHSLQAIFLNELVGYVLPKCVPGAARRDTPPRAIVRVRPEQVAHGTLVRHLDHAVDIANHVQCVQTGRKAAM